jgi:hypothetical protein
MHKIALEELFITPALEPYLLPAIPAVSDKTQDRTRACLP